MSSRRDNALAASDAEAMFAAVHKAGECRFRLRPGRFPLQHAHRAWSSLTNPPEPPPQISLKNEKIKDPRGSFALLVLQTLVID